MYDCIILGGGPAGVTAGVYAGRKKLKTLLLTETFGGQSVVSHGIENWIGEKSIPGYMLAKKLEDHVRAQETVEIKTFEIADKIRKNQESKIFTVTTPKGEYKTKSIVITSGSRRRKLGIPGEDALNGRGVAYCSTCDAPFFKNKKAAVIGGGNAGLEAVIDLLPYADQIYLLHRKPELKGDSITQEKVRSSGKVTILLDITPDAILGDQKVTGLRYRINSSAETKEIGLDGVFVEIGSMPNSEMAKDLVEINPRGEIVIDHKLGTTSCEGIFAAGDVTDTVYKQNNISVGAAVIATLSAYQYVLKAQNSRQANVSDARSAYLE